MRVHWWSEWHGQELFMQRQLAKSVAKLNIQLQGIVIFVRINICHGELHVRTGGQSGMDKCDYGKCSLQNQQLRLINSCKQLLNV